MSIPEEQAEQSNQYTVTSIDKRIQSLENKVHALELENSKFEGAGVVFKVLLAIIGAAGSLYLFFKDHWK